MWFWQKYASRPVHLMGFFAFLLGAFGVFCGLLSAWLKWGPEQKDLSNTFLPNVAFFSVLIAIQLFVTGILMDIMIKSYFKDTKPYKIREIIKR
jgi:membrane-bound acyltransferase YfiQ involved in biofilm formation